jgi:Tfp pilus assembly protein PilX
MIHRQQGFTLVIGLVFLLLMTLVAVTAFHLERTNLAATANSQYRNEALAYAQDAINVTLSGTAFFDPSGSAIPSNPYSACDRTNTYCGDVNGDGTVDYTVDLTPPPHCKTATAIPNASLDLSDPEDQGCTTGVSQSFGVSGAATGDSLCAGSLWEITAVSKDAATGTSATLFTGVSVRVPLDSVLTSCP